VPRPPPSARFLTRLGGSCTTALGAHAALARACGDGPVLSMIAAVASEDGARVLRASASGAPERAESLGQELAETLLARGAGRGGDAAAGTLDTMTVGGPLAGRTIVVTRAAAQAPVFVELLQNEGARVLEAPTIAIDPPMSWAPLDAALSAIERYTWVVFTSVNGVAMVDRRLRERGDAWERAGAAPDRRHRSRHGSRAHGSRASGRTWCRPSSAPRRSWSPSVASWGVTTSCSCRGRPRHATSS
jgi:hypothetical protein